MSKEKDNKPDPLAPAHPPTMEAGAKLPPHLASVQASSQGPKPHVAPLVKTADLEHGVDTPPAAPMAGDLPVPRVIHQNERAPQGLKRFKIRCDNLLSQPLYYILAKDEAGARACYLEHSGLKGVLEQAGNANNDPQIVHLAVRPLVD